MTQKRDSRYGLITSPMHAGVERLWGHLQQNGLIVNGKEATLAAWCDGSGLNDSAKTLTCRHSGIVLAEVGAGSSPDLTGYAPHLQDRAATFVNGKGLGAQAGSKTVGNVGTDDLLLIVAAAQSAANGLLAGKRKATGGYGAGYTLYSNSSGVYKGWIGDGVDSLEIGTVDLVGPYFLFVLGVNKDEASVNGMVLNVNGAEDETGDPSAVGDLDESTDGITVGCYATGINAFEGSVALMAVYHAANLFSAGATGRAEINAIGKQLAALYFGTTPLHTHGPDTPESF